MIASTYCEELESCSPFSSNICGAEAEAPSSLTCALCPFEFARLLLTDLMRLVVIQQCHGLHIPFLRSSKVDLVVVMI